MGRYINVSLADYQRAASKKSALDELYDELDKLKEQYEKRGETGTLPDLDLPDSLDLDRLDTTKKSEEELRKQAEAENAGKYDDKLIELKQQAEKREQELKERMIESAGAATEHQKKIDEAYDKANASTENQALKRGLARSSIIMNMLAENEKGRIGDKQAIDAASRKEIFSLQQTIDALSRELEDKRDVYTTKQRQDVEKRLLDLLEQQEDKYLEAVKYNNDVTKKEADYLRQREAAVLSRAKAVADLNKSESLYGSELGQRKYLEAKFSAVQSYLDGMDKKEALKLLENDKRIREELGSYYRLMRRYLESK